MWVGLSTGQAFRRAPGACDYIHPTALNLPSVSFLLQALLTALTLEADLQAKRQAAAAAAADPTCPPAKRQVLQQAATALEPSLSAAKGALATLCMLARVIAHRPSAQGYTLIVAVTATCMPRQTDSCCKTCLKHCCLMTVCCHRRVRASQEHQHSRERLAVQSAPGGAAPGAGGAGGGQRSGGAAAGGAVGQHRGRLPARRGGHTADGGARAAAAAGAAASGAGAGRQRQQRVALVIWQQQSIRRMDFPAIASRCKCPASLLLGRALHGGFIHLYHPGATAENYP